jgi:hypothetical protein
MRSLTILFMAISIVSCKQDTKEIGDLKEQAPITVIPSDSGNRDVSTIANGDGSSEDRASNNPNYEKQLEVIKEEISQSMVILGERGSWKLRFMVNDQGAKIDTDLLFKLRFSNLTLLPGNKSAFIVDLEKMQDKLLEWQETYRKTGSIKLFSRDNKLFEKYLPFFQKGAEQLADHLISETDNFFHICSKGERDEAKYFPIISIQNLFPEKDCKSLFQVYNNELRILELNAGIYSDFHFTNLQAIRGFNIVTLTIFGSENSSIDGSLDLSPLKDMKSLNYFASEYNKVSDLSPLAKLKGLTYISIYPKEEYKYIKVCPTSSENQALNKFCTNAGFPR